MHRIVLAIAGLGAVIVIGLALATVVPSIGTAIAVVGIVTLALLLVAVFLIAWRGDQKRAWGPGSLRREYLEERRAKQNEQAAAQDEAPKQP